MDTALKEQLEENMAQMDYETQMLWGQLREEIFKNFEVEHSCQNSRNAINDKSFLLALSDQSFVIRLFAKIIEHRVTANSHIYFFQPKPNFVTQNYRDITFYFYKKVQEFSPSVKDMSLPYAPSIVVGDKTIALVCIAKNTDDVEIYLWDCGLCCD